MPSKKKADPTKLSVEARRCLRCGGVWIPRKKSRANVAGRILKEPLRCSHCKTPYWNIAPVYKKNEKKAVNQ